MEITRQQTPNPNALKLILPRKFFEKPQNFPTAEAAANHPLAASFFALGSIYNVFMAQDFITINKLPDAEWEPLATKAEAVIQKHFGA